MPNGVIVTVAASSGAAGAGAGDGAGGGETAGDGAVDGELALDEPHPAIATDATIARRHAPGNRISGIVSEVSRNCR
jgi:hypothetical protein